MAWVVQRRLISISVSVLFFVSDVYSQEPGTLVVQTLDKNGNNKFAYPCKCYVRLDANEPVQLDDAERFYSCEVISKQGSTVELNLHAPTKNKTPNIIKTASCSLRTRTEGRDGIWQKGPKSFESSSKNESCFLITDMIINDRVDTVHIYYSFLLIALVMGTLYASYKYNLLMKLKERCQSRLDWDRLPLNSKEPTAPARPMDEI